MLKYCFLLNIRTRNVRESGCFFIVAELPRIRVRVFIYSSVIVRYIIIFFQFDFILSVFIIHFADILTNFTNMLNYPDFKALPGNGNV